MSKNRISFLFLLVFILSASPAFAGDVLFETTLPWYYWWSDMDWGTGGFTYVSDVSIGYKPSIDQELCTVKAGLYKLGNPADNVVMTVRGGGNGYPTGGTVLSTVTVLSSQVANSPLLPQQTVYTAFSLFPCLNLTTNTDYTFTFSRTQPNSSGNYVSQISNLIFYPETKFWAYVPVNGFWQEKTGYEPALRLEGSEPQNKEPVIIVPGILGSKLNRVLDGEEVWPNQIDLITSLSDDFLDDLILSTSGEQVSGKELNTSEILEEAWPFTVYGNLVNAFRDKGYEDGKDLFTVAYDWRFSVHNSADILADTIQQALNNSPTGKINIIAHSMGGLVTKEYLSRSGVSDTVNNVVLLGVPHLGAPKTFKVLNYGDDFDLNKFGVGLNEQKAKEISQNMPGVYELLPSREYITLKGGYVRDFRNSQNLTLNYDQTTNFMTSDSDLPDYRNNLLINSADSYHQSVDTNPITGPNVFNVMGCQNPDTIGEIRLYDKGNVDITAVDGDGTVPLISARANSDNHTNYFVLYSQTKVDHTGLVKNDNVTKLVSDLITEDSPTVPSGISQSISDCLDALPNPTKIIFSTHSPVSLHIYDEQNNHTGLNSNGDFEANIPDSNYYMIGDNSFASVPAENQYRIVIDALSSGSFDFKIKSYNGSVLANSAAYLNVPLPDESFIAEMNFTKINSNIELNIDKNGDSIIDQIKIPDVELSGTVNEDVTPPVITIIEPASSSYTRSSLLPIRVNTNDSESGIGLIQKYFDDRLIASESLDLFFEKLGSHSIEFTAYDNSGNPANTSKDIQIVATFDSTISDIERAYSLGWIEKKSIKNGLVNKLEAAIKIEKRIEVLEEKLPDKPKVIRRIERLEKRLDKVLRTAFLNQLEKEYNKGNINEQANNLLKKDIEWLLAY